MNQEFKEKAKSILLVILIFTSLVQVGILWDYQNHGLPISFLSGIFGKYSISTTTDIKKMKEDYFVPYRVIVSEGFDESRWVIGKNNEQFKKIWNEVKNTYLKELLNSKPVQVMPYTDEQWGTLILKKAFVVEFRTNIRVDLIASFLNISNISSSEPSGIYKIAVLPWEDINYNTNTIYIQDDSKIYKYVVSIPSKALTKDSLEEVIYKLDQDTTLRNYSVITELNFYNKAKFPIKQDVTFITKGPKYSEYRNLICSAPDGFDTRNPEELASKILGNEKDSYDPSMDVNDAVIFKNKNNLYRVYNDGLVEYKSLSPIEETDKGNVKEAFDNVLEFMSKLKRLLPNQGIDIHISDIKENKDSFEFTFDYTYNGMPIFFNYNVNGTETRQLNSAITISSNGKKVINCWWIFKKIDSGKEVNQYDVIFTDLMDDFSKNIGTSKYANIFIKDINMYYRITSDGSAKSIEPVWIVTTRDDGYYPVPMRKKKGD